MLAIARSLAFTLFELSALHTKRAYQPPPSLLTRETATIVMLISVDITLRFDDFVAIKSLLGPICYAMVAAEARG